MDFALQAALMGAIMGSAVLAMATVYGWTLPAAHSSFGWFAGSFVLETASKAVLLGGASITYVEISDLAHGLAAGLSFCGGLTLINVRINVVILTSGLALAGVWAAVVQTLREIFGLSGLPMFGVGGIALLFCAWAFWATSAGRYSDGWRNEAHKLAGLIFFAAGVHQLAAPLLHAHSMTATWSFVASQFLSMVMSVALLLVVLRRQQTVAEREGQRANLLQSRLVDAMGSVQDAVALFDNHDRLITCNNLYREFLSPAADQIQPGKSFEAILRAEAERGVVLDALGQEDEWVQTLCNDHSLAKAPAREYQLFDGRWVSVSVYRTMDGGHLRILRDVTNRKQAEIALQESVSWLRGIMDTVVDGIITMDETCTVLSFNAAAESIFGYEASEVVGRNVSMLMPDAYSRHHDHYVKRYQETGVARVIGIGRQVEGLRKDGSVFPLDVALAEMRDGDLVTFIGVVRDITDRKSVENALLESEQRFRDLAESASDWFWEVDQDLRFTFVSGRVRHVLGVGPNFFAGRTFEEICGLADSRSARDDQTAIMEERLPFRDYVCLPPLPEQKFVEMAGRPIFDAQGKFRGYRGTATDITPIKQHQLEIAAQSAQRQAIIDNMGQGIAVFDQNEQLVALNQLARRQIGGVDDLRDTRLEGLLRHLIAMGEFGTTDVVAKMAGGLAILRKHPNQIFEHRRPNGTVLEVRSTAMPGGGLILTMTDITDRKKAEDTLREAKEEAERGNRSKATFLANISHELRTPLNAIIGFSELMTHKIFGEVQPVAYQSYVTDIHESGMHLLELINDILDMSKAEAGMTDLLETDVDMVQVLQSSVRMVGKKAAASKVHLVDELAPDLPLLLGDERRLRQIALNLISNAVKFTDEGGAVIVKAHVDSEGFHMAVQDTGIGMSEEDLVKVMEPFVQADTRLSRKYEGTGLGLPLTKALVEAHGGRLTLTSVLGEGTCVHVLLPPSRVLGKHQVMREFESTAGV